MVPRQSSPLILLHKSKDNRVCVPDPGVIISLRTAPVVVENQWQIGAIFYVVHPHCFSPFLRPAFSPLTQTRLASPPSSICSPTHSMIPHYFLTLRARLWCYIYVVFVLHLSFSLFLLVTSWFLGVKCYRFFISHTCYYFLLLDRCLFSSLFLLLLFVAVLHNCLLLIFQFCLLLASCFFSSSYLCPSAVRSLSLCSCLLARVIIIFLVLLFVFLFTLHYYTYLYVTVHVLVWWQCWKSDIVCPCKDQYIFSFSPIIRLQHYCA